MKPNKLFAAKLEKRLNEKADDLAKYAGIIGDGYGRVYFGASKTSVYVRVGNQISVAICTRVQPYDGMAVWVGFANEEKTLYQVLSTRTIDTKSTNPANGYAPANRYRYMAKGGGQDPLWIENRAWLPLRVGTGGGMSINLYEGYLWTGTNFIFIPTDSAVDLTSHIPSTSGKAAWVMITMNNAGTVIETKGTEVDLADLCPVGNELLNLPDVPSGTIECLAAIRVYEGQTEIREGRATLDGTGAAFTDIIDLRGIYNSSFLSVFDDAKAPTGWLDPDNIDVSYDKTNRTITLTGNLDFYWNGVKKSLSSPWTSDAHTNSAGSYYLYSTDGITFAWSTDVWSFYHLMIAKAIKGTDSFALRETHGLMQWQVHEELHEVVSSFRESGGALVAGTYAENTPTDAANSPGFAVATIQDEDLHTTIPAWSEGGYTTMWIGSSSVSTFDTTATLPFRYASGGYIYYNVPTTGAETQAANNRYLNVYQILVPTASDTDSQKYRMLMLQPQAQYTSLAAAQAEDTRGLVLGNFGVSAPEFVIYARITYITASGDANNGKCRIATNGVTYIAGSKLGQVSVSGYAPPNAENIPFTPTGGISSTNVQAAIVEVSNKVGGGTIQRNLTSNLALANGECMTIISYANLGAYDLQLSGDAELKIL